MATRCLMPVFLLTGYLQISTGIDLDVYKILKKTDVITELNPLWTAKGERIVEGDIVVPNFKDSRETNEIEDRKAIVNVATIWYNGIVPYSYHPSVEPDTRENIKKAIEHWQNITCLRFREVMIDFYYLRFRSDTLGCWSFIGQTVVAPLAPQDVSIGKGCNTVHIIVHEIGHAIGFYHEQSRNDRAGFIDILWHNMDSARYSQFDKGLESSRNVQYDLLSGMHYGAMAFSSRLFEKNTMATKNIFHQRLMGAGFGLSHRDGKLANILYSCSAGCPNLADQAKCQNDGYLSPYRRDKQPCFCVCPPGTSGEFCETVVGDYYPPLPCGGKITEETEIQTPGYPTRSPDVDDSCTWWIEAPPGMRTQLEFIDFSFHPRLNLSTSYYDGRCVVERVEIRTQDKNDGDMFCDEDISPGTITKSKDRDIYIVIAGNNEKKTGRGLRAKVTYVAGTSASTQGPPGSTEDPSSSTEGPSASTEEGSSGSTENKLSNLLPKLTSHRVEK